MLTSEHANKLTCWHANSLGSWTELASCSGALQSFLGSMKECVTVNTVIYQDTKYRDMIFFGPYRPSMCVQYLWLSSHDSKRHDCLPARLFSLCFYYKFHNKKWFSHQTQCQTQILVLVQPEAFYCRIVIHSHCNRSVYCLEHDINISVVFAQAQVGLSVISYISETTV